MRAPNTRNRMTFTPTDKAIKPKELEADVTKAIRDYLSLRGIWHYKHAQGPFGRAGISDIIGMYNGRYLAIEVKTKTGRVSEHQQEFIDEVKANGGIAFVARSVDDVINGLREV
jgi:hypothetical protein